MTAVSLMAGTWQGRYFYDAVEGFAVEGAAFTMNLKSTWWLGRFAGTCVDHDSVLKEDPPRVVGRIRGSKIRLEKKYREAWVITSERTQTVRHWLAGFDIVTESYIPPQVVEYTGKTIGHSISSATESLERPAEVRILLGNETGSAG